MINLKNIREEIRENFVRTKEAYAAYSKDGKELLTSFLITRAYNGHSKDYSLQLLYNDLELSMEFSNNEDLAKYIYDNFAFIVEISVPEFLESVDISSWKVNEIKREEKSG